MFFVLNTGRAGSKTIAKVLSQAPGCECLHEPEPTLIEEAPSYRYGSCDADSILEILRRTRTDPGRTGAYGESNNRMALIVPLLERAFPDSRYLWLVRDGRDFVASVYQRGWFSEREYADDAGPWSRWRLQGDLVGDVDPVEWSAWSPFERCCWIWDYTNRLIRRDLAAIEDERWLLVRIENLATSLHEICRFLGIASTNFVVHRANRRTAEDDAEGTTNRVSSVSTWHEWSAEQRNMFVRRCGKLMDELYPTWRDGEDWHGSSQEVEGKAMMVTNGEHRQGTPGEIESIRADLAELKLLRGDLRALTRLYTAMGRRSESHFEVVTADLDGLRKVVERAGEADAVRAIQDEFAIARRRAQRAEENAEDARASLENTRTALEQARVELATAVERSRTLEDDRNTYRERYQRTIRERNAERDRANALARSTSYRFGHAVVMLAKHPIRTPLGVARRVWRRLRAPASSAATAKGTAPGDAGQLTSPGTAGSSPPAAPVGKPTPTDSPTRSPVTPTEGREVKPQRNQKPVLSDGYPVYAYVALGFDRERLRALARAVRQTATVSGKHVPLIVTDSPSFSFVRDIGVAVEYIPDRETWEDHVKRIGWEEFRSDRVAHLLQVHQPARTIVVDPMESLELPRLLDLNPDLP